MLGVMCVLRGSHMHARVPRVHYIVLATQSSPLLGRVCWVPVTRVRGASGRIRTCGAEERLPFLTFICLAMMADSLVNQKTQEHRQMGGRASLAQAAPVVSPSSLDAPIALVGWDSLRKEGGTGQVWLTPVISAPGRQRQNCCKFKGSLFYTYRPCQKEKVEVW